MPKRPGMLFGTVFWSRRISRSWLSKVLKSSTRADHLYLFNFMTLELLAAASR
jgi:hypothetical protein